MKNFEILKKLKISYDNLSDILLNSEYEFNNDDQVILDKSLNIISTLYEKMWDTIKIDKDEKEKLKTMCKCPHCNKNVLISDFVDYSYLCTECEENFYYHECIEDTKIDEHNMEMI